LTVSSDKDKDCFRKTRDFMLRRKPISTAAREAWVWQKRIVEEQDKCK